MCYTSLHRDAVGTHRGAVGFDPATTNSGHEPNGVGFRRGVTEPGFPMSVPTPIRRLAALAFGCLLLAAPARAATALRLPTDGYVRPGRYFPVEVRADGPARVALRAPGCLPTDADVAGWATVPVLAVGPPGPLTGGDGPPLPLRVPAEGERLVAAATGLPPAAADLFPGDRLVPVRLDPSDPLPGPPAAWEVLDAVVLDPAAVAALTDARRSALLAGGVTLAVTGDAPPDAPPDARWPWRRRGRLWALSPSPAGPAAGVVLPDAYAPTDAWTPGWSPAVRAAAGTAAVLVAIAVVALTRFRRPWLAVAAPVAASAVATAAVAVWRLTLDPVARGGGDVTVVTPALAQRDAWVYERARSPADVAVPWSGWTHPAFASDGALADGRPTLTVSADGRLAWAVHLPAGSAVAFVHRDVSPAGPPPPVTGRRGAAMRDAAPLYLSAGDRLAGETPAAPGRWPGVLVIRP